MDDEADTGGAERAFEALRAEVAALRQAVEGQTAPDYALTLGAIVKELQAVGARLTSDRGPPGVGDDAGGIFRAIHRRCGACAPGRRQSGVGRPDAD